MIHNRSNTSVHHSIKGNINKKRPQFSFPSWPSYLAWRLGIVNMEVWHSIYTSRGQRRGWERLGSPHVVVLSGKAVSTPITRKQCNCCEFHNLVCFTVTVFSEPSPSLSMDRWWRPSQYTTNVYFAILLYSFRYCKDCIMFHQLAKLINPGQNIIQNTICINLGSVVFQLVLTRLKV